MKSGVFLFCIFLSAILSADEKLSEIVKAKILERQQFHLKNSLNPYYKEQLREQQVRKEQEAIAQAAGPTAVRAATGAKEAPENPRELTQQVNRKAGALGKAGKTRTENRQEQERR